MQKRSKVKKAEKIKTKGKKLKIENNKMYDQIGPAKVHYFGAFRPILVIRPKIDRTSQTLPHKDKEVH